MKEEKAIFAGGCFWGMQYHFEKLPGVIETKVGYTGGDKKDPLYDQVSTGTTGHAESLEITFNSEIISYEELAKLFFEIHDPTQVNRQGPDVGTQYRSAIFYLNDDQKNTAQKLIKLLKEKGYKVSTELTKAEKFYEAEDYHQFYYDKTGGEPYCHIYTKRFL